jgi:hypothetical protein
MAQFGGTEACVFTRTAEHNGKLYLDMADKTWRAIEIDADGWRIIDRPPVHFVRRKGVLALPEPEHGGSIDELRELLNVASEDDFKLVVGWLLAAMYPRGPYPLLSLSGEAGTAKSSAAELLRSLVDPNASPLRNTPSDERDLFISATNSGMLVLDNLSGISAPLSDALCRVSTGGGFATRELHTNDEEMIFDVMRPMLITSTARSKFAPSLPRAHLRTCFGRAVLESISWQYALSAGNPERACGKWVRIFRGAYCRGRGGCPLGSRRPLDPGDAHDDPQGASYDQEGFRGSVGAGAAPHSWRPSRWNGARRTGTAQCLPR